MDPLPPAVDHQGPGDGHDEVGAEGRVKAATAASPTHRGWGMNLAAAEDAQGGDGALRMQHDTVTGSIKSWNMRKPPNTTWLITSIRRSSSLIPIPIGLTIQVNASTAKTAAYPNRHPRFGCISDSRFLIKAICAAKAVRAIGLGPSGKVCVATKKHTLKTTMLTASVPRPKPKREAGISEVSFAPHPVLGRRRFRNDSDINHCAMAHLLGSALS